MKTLLFLLLTTGCWLSMQTVAQVPGEAYPMDSHAGIIERIDYGSSTMIVSGYRYSVAADAEVEVGGSYGAFTMLQPGMQIYFDYLVISSTDRRLVLIKEVPDHVLVEES